MQKTLALLSLILLALAIAGFARYLSDIRTSYQRISGKSLFFESDHGVIEYTRRRANQSDANDTVLIIHGAGGGFDQGELIADVLLDHSFDTIAVSRFGYLGSTLPDNASWDDQAHAYARLLDHLQVDRVAVLAMSQGGPSALMFAVLYPQRITSLVCLSCGVAPPQAEAEALSQASADRQGNRLRQLFQRDLPYWLISRLFRPTLLNLIGASPDVLNHMSEQQRLLANRFIMEMNPASPRAAGVVFDNETPLPGFRIASISTPTLLVHAKDDTLQLFRNAVFASEHIPGAQLMSFEQGGHLLAIVERDSIRAGVQAFIRENND